MTPKKRHAIALAGNPNTGKSTVFNALTGGKQEIGNWPGKTVERKKGVMKHKKAAFDVTDLPGTYSLSAFSPEELIARNFIVEGKPEVVIDIVDASNLERNLYLAVQLMELGANVLIALNMVDSARNRGFRIDAGKLSKLLGIPVVPTIANKEKGIKRLIDETVKAAGRKKKPFRINYGKDLEPKIEELEEHIDDHASKLAEKYGARWLAVKLIERDKEVIEKIKKADPYIYDKRLEKFIKNAERIYGENTDIEMADKRYGFIRGVVQKTVKKTVVSEITASDRIDRIVTSRWLGIPIFLAIMYVLYQLVFIAGEPFVSMIEEALEWTALSVGAHLVSSGASPMVISFAVSGIIEGVGNVLVFLPNIALLFIVIALLEDSGYMARAAFVMEELMGRIGLHGKSFVPMVVAFGCNVPAVMAARTLDNEKDRKITTLIAPLIPCSARIVVFVFIAGAFFAPETAARIVWSLVVLSLLLVIMTGFLFKKFLLPGPRAPFVMELPPYKLPTLGGILLHAWGRTKLFIKTAGSFIFLAAIVIWLMASYPEGAAYGSSESYIGQLGLLILPVFAPLGFDWIGSVALLFGLAAKEVLISAFGILYGVGSEGALQETIAEAWTPLQAYIFMVFTLLYIPCIATVAVIKRETNSWKWAAFAVAYTFALAWMVSFLILQMANIMGY